MGSYTLMKKLFLQANSLWSVLFLILQQTIVALSTVLIALLAKHILEQSNYRALLVAFVLSLLVVYIPGILHIKYLERSVFTAFARYVQLYVRSNQGRCTVYANTRYRQAHESTLTTEAYIVVNECGSVIYSFLAILINVLFNIISLGFVLDPLLILAYGVAFLLLSGVLLAANGAIQDRSSRFQQARKKMSALMSLGWDNIYLNNQYNINIWLATFKHRWDKLQITGTTSAVYTNWISAFAMIIALTPILATVLLLYTKYWQDRAVLAMITATLPRQIQLIQNLFEVFSISAQFSSVFAKVKGLATSIDSIEPAIDIASYIDLPNIEVKSSEVRSYTTLKGLYRSICDRSSGRLTIRGGNGVGKSTLLIWLLSKLPDCFLLPANSQLVFNSTHQPLSSGERTLHTLREIQENVTSKFILLDEWDANLDNENLLQASQLIDQMAQHIVVIEVRHRVDSV